ncbi:MAG: hypothetical protein JWM47_4589 [Acidimicrobiales bacterium]|nr:hypothetical protein [Acidimicrobiales bacterium]
MSLKVANVNYVKAPLTVPNGMLRGGSRKLPEGFGGVNGKTPAMKLPAFSAPRVLSKVEKEATEWYNRKKQLEAEDAQQENMLSYLGLDNRGVYPPIIRERRAVNMNNVTASVSTSGNDLSPKPLSIVPPQPAPPLTKKGKGKDNIAQVHPITKQLSTTSTQTMEDIAKENTSVAPVASGSRDATPPQMTVNHYYNQMFQHHNLNNYISNHNLYQQIANNQYQTLTQNFQTNQQLINQFNDNRVVNNLLQQDNRTAIQNTLVQNNLNQNNLNLHGQTGVFATEQKRVGGTAAVDVYRDGPMVEELPNGRTASRRRLTTPYSRRRPLQVENRLYLEGPERRVVKSERGTRRSSGENQLVVRQGNEVAPR